VRSPSDAIGSTTLETICSWSRDVKRLGSSSRDMIHVHLTHTHTHTHTHVGHVNRDSAIGVCVCVCVSGFVYKMGILRVYAVSTGETGTTTHRQLWKHCQPWIPQLIIIDILAAEGPGSMLLTGNVYGDVGRV